MTKQENDMYSFLDAQNVKDVPKQSSENKQQKQMIQKVLDFLNF